MVIKAKDPRARVSNKSRNIKRGKRPAVTEAAAAAAIVAPDGTDDRQTRAYLIAQEIKFAKLFAGNDTKLSEKQLKRLRRWLKIRSSSSFPFDRNNFMRIWKGLFYSMWMSDKPLPQEQLANNIATLVQAFEQPAVAVEFFGAFLQTMSAEWFGIDQWRIDKFMMLVRRCARQMLVLVHQHSWPVELIELLNGQLSLTVLRSSASIGFFMHFTELWLEEVAKVSQGELPVEAVTSLLQPFGAYLGRPRDAKLCRHVVKHVFNYLLFQSEMGREYQDRFEAWKSVGFAGNTIEAMEKAEEEDDEEEADDDAENVEGDEDDEENADADEDDVEDEESAEEDGEQVQHLDPRAGRVDVIMPEIKFDAMEIVRLLEVEKTKPHTNVKSRQQITRVINNYTTYAGGKFPLGIQQIKLKSDVIDLPKLDDKVNELVLFERKLRKQNDELKNLNKRNRKKVLAGKPLTESALAAAAARRTKHQRQHQELYEEQYEKPKKAKRQQHEHDGNGCCGGHDQPPKKRRSITPAEKAKINQWDEEDIEADAQPVAAPLKSALKVKPSPVAVEPIATPAAATTVATPKKSALKQSVATPVATATASTTNGHSNGDPWLEPLQDGEVEFSTPSRKLKLAQINGKLAPLATPDPSSTARKVINPAALLLSRTPQTPVGRSAERKSVKIMLQMNRSQEKSEYFAQLRNSPNTPFDANRVPPKGALKPNLMPSPINPYYKKKIGLSFD